MSPIPVASAYASASRLLSSLLVIGDLLSRIALVRGQGRHVEMACLGSSVAISDLLLLGEPEKTPRRGFGNSFVSGMSDVSISVSGMDASGSRLCPLVSSHVNGQCSRRVLSMKPVWMPASRLAAADRMSWLGGAGSI